MLLLCFLFIFGVNAETPPSKCTIENTVYNTLVITDETQDSKLVIYGHQHRNYYALDTFSKMVNAIDTSTTESALEGISKVRGWNNNELKSYYIRYAEDEYQRILDLAKEHSVDFVGLETPYAAMTNHRSAQLEETSRIYREALEKAYGPTNINTLHRRDMLGMIGSNYYYSIQTNPNVTVEGVESGLLEKRWWKLYQSLGDYLTKINKQKTEENAEVVDEIIQTLSSTRGSANTALLLARTKGLSISIQNDIQKFGTIDSQYRDSYDLRETLMLRSMKARANKSGLLVIGQAHITSIKKKFEAFCKFPRVRFKQTNPQAIESTD